MDAHQMEPHCHLVLKSVIDLERHWQSALSVWSLLRENGLEKTTQFEQIPPLLVGGGGVR